MTNLSIGLPTAMAIVKIKKAIVKIKNSVIEFGWIGMGQVASVAASLFLIKILTGYLSPSQFGQLTLALTLGGFVSQVAFAGVVPGVMRYYTIAMERDDLNGYYLASRKLMLYGTGAALVLSGILLLGSAFINGIDWLWVIFVSILFTVIGNYNMTLSAVQNAARRRKIAALHGMIEAWLKVLLVVGICWSGFSDPSTIIIGYMVSSLMVLGSQVYFIRKLIPLRRSSDNAKTRWMSQMWVYSKPFVYLNVFTWLQASSDRWALDAFAGREDVGRYAVLMQLGYAPIVTATGMTVTFISPILFHRSGDCTDSLRNVMARKLAWKIIAVIMAITVGVTLFTYIFHEIIFILLVAKEYRSISGLLPWMIFAGGLFSASQMLTLKLMSDLNTTLLITPKIVTSIIGVTLSFLGAYISGVSGVIISLVIFSIINIIWIYVVSRCSDKNLRENANQNKGGL